MNAWRNRKLLALSLLEGTLGRRSFRRALLLSLRAGQLINSITRRLIGTLTRTRCQNPPAARLAFSRHGSLPHMEYNNLRRHRRHPRSILCSQHAPGGCRVIARISAGLHEWCEAFQYDDHMHRLTISISLVVLLGVVTSVAVAWSAVWRFGWIARNGPLNTLTLSERYGASSGVRAWRFAQVSTWGFTYVYRYPSMSRGSAVVATSPYWSAVRHAPRAKDVPYTEWTAGVPFRCMIGHAGPVRASLLGERDGLIAVGESNLRVRSMSLSRFPLMLPYLPIWPGLLANTAICGGAWWALLFGPGVLKRWHRRRTGRCVTCGYDLRGLSGRSEGVCPECGDEMIQQKV